MPSEVSVAASMKPMGTKNILLLRPALPSHAHTASSARAASSWLAAPNSGQMMV